MSVSAAQASAFFREAIEHGQVFTIRDAGGIPAPSTGSEGRAMPFWSLESRAQRVIDTVPAYSEFTVVTVTLADFRGKWIPGLANDGLQIGINWSGVAATGYDLTPADVAARLVALDH